MTRIAFVDTETTGLALDDDIWEFAAIIRDDDGDETHHHMLIEHDRAKCEALPDEFLRDHRERFPVAGHGQPKLHDVWTRKEAAKGIAALLTDKIHIVGCVPNFDTERIALLLRRFGFEPGWHYHLCDVENLAVGYLNGVVRQAGDTLEGRGLPHDALDQLPQMLASPPWDSEVLSRAVGVDPDQFDRHTALGDAQWARAIWDAVTGSRP